MPSAVPQDRRVSTPKNPPRPRCCPPPIGMATRLNTTGNNAAHDFVSLSNSRSSRPGSRGMENTSNVGEVLEFDHGVRAYPPAVPRGLWPLPWAEPHPPP